MKSRILWLFALVLGVVSCSKDTGVDNTLPPVAEKVRITASMDVTRTSLGENLEVLWSENDVISLYGDTKSDFAIVEGVGTTTAVFEGYLPESSDGVIYATYGYWWNPTNGYLENQNYVAGSFGTGYDRGTDLGAVPMIAAYNAEDNSLAFKNVAGILRVDIAGSGLLESLSLHDALEENYLTGDYMFDPETLEISGWFSGYYYTSIQNINVELTSEAQSFYVVCPPCTINELEVTMYFNDARDNVKVTATNAITVERGVITPLSPVITVEAPVTPTVKDWGVVGSFNAWAPDNSIPMEVLNGGAMVVAYGVELVAGDEFKFVLGDTWTYDNYGYSGNSPILAGHYYDAAYYGGNIVVEADGTYDLYLDLENEKFYVMAAGDDIADATVGEVTYGVVGNLLNNSWGEDTVMSYMGDGWYCATNIVFTARSFKIRINGDWSTALGVASSDIYYTDAPIAVSLTDTYDINVDVIPGLGYDVWYDSNKSEVWVMRHDVVPGDIPMEYIEFEMPYMFGMEYAEDINGYGMECSTQFILTDTPLVEGWTSVGTGNNFLFTISFNAVDRTAYPRTIIMNDLTTDVVMAGLNCYCTYVEGGQLGGVEMFDSAVLTAKADGIEAYVTIGSEVYHIVYNGAPKLGFYDFDEGTGGTEQFVFSEEFDPVWK